MNPVEYLESNLAHVEEAVKSVCFRHGLTGHDREDFDAQIKLRLIEDDYRAIREFSGKSSFKTYLYIVISRIFIDMKRQAEGRWRPSEKSKKLGELHIKIEELLCRDKHTLDEVFHILTTNHHISISFSELHDIASELSLKLRMSSKDDGSDVLDVLSDGRLQPDEMMVNRELAGVKKKIDEIMDGLRKSLNAEDRLITKMKFEDGFSISEISRVLGKERSLVDKQLKYILNSFKEGILASGIPMHDVIELIKRIEIIGENSA